jgi:hypothetical protein
MGNDHSPGCDPGCHLRQTARNIFIRQAVESVPTHAFNIEALRNRVVISERAVAAVEGGIEAGDLSKVGEAGKKRADRGKIIRLVQGRERNIAFEIGLKGILVFL